MSSVYSPTPVGLTDITIPDDGDDLDAASVNTPIEALADAIAAISPSATLMLTAYPRLRWITLSESSASPNVASGGMRMIVVSSTDVDVNDGIWGRFEIAAVNSGAALANVFGIEIGTDLHPYHGWTLTTCVLTLQGKSPHDALPALMPRAALARYDAGASASLCSTAWAIDASADTTAYQASHTITLTVDQNNVIDADSYDYIFLVQNEGNTNGVAGLKIDKIVLTFTAPT